MKLAAGIIAIVIVVIVVLANSFVSKMITDKRKAIYNDFKSTYGEFGVIRYGLIPGNAFAKENGIMVAVDQEGRIIDALMVESEGMEITTYTVSEIIGHSIQELKEKYDKIDVNYYANKALSQKDKALKSVLRQF